MSQINRCRLAMSLGRRLGLAFALAAGVATSVAAAPAPKLAISYSEKVGDELPLWIAADGGYFQKNGLDVTLDYLPAQEGVPALLSGQIQMASIGGADVLSAVAQGAKIKFVAGSTPVFTFQLWAQPKHATANGLKGQRIGVPSTTGALYTGTVLTLRQLGLKPSDVAITPLGSTANVNNALLAGSIVAAASHPPATYYFKQHGLIEMVDLPKSRIPSTIGGLAVADTYIEAHPKIVQAAVNAIAEAIQREKTDRAFTERMLSKYMNVTQKAVLDFTYNFYVNEATPSAIPTAAELKVVQGALAVTDAKVKNVDLASMIDESFAKKAEKRLDAK